MGEDRSLEELMASLQRLGRLFASRQVATRITTAAGAEVTQQGATLLRALLRGGRQSVVELGHSAAMDLGAVSRQVRLLEKAGAVQRLRSPDDGRVALLELTADGTKVARRIRAVGVQHLERALVDWSDADKRSLASLLGRLVDDMVGTPVPSKSRRAPRRDLIDQVK
jgi:DNA-binding MarR family transcriptional regulator